MATSQRPSSVRHPGQDAQPCPCGRKAVVPVVPRAEHAPTERQLARPTCPAPAELRGPPPGRGNRLSGRPQATRGAARGRRFKSTRREGAGGAAWGPEPPETRPAPGRQGRRAAGSVAQWARRLHRFRRSVAGFCLKDVPGDHRHLIYF